MQIPLLWEISSSSVHIILSFDGVKIWYLLHWPLVSICFALLASSPIICSQHLPILCRSHFTLSVPLTFPLLSYYQSSVARFFSSFILTYHDSHSLWLTRFDSFLLILPFSLPPRLIIIWSTCAIKTKVSIIAHHRGLSAAVVHHPRRKLPLNHWRSWRTGATRRH